MRRLVYTLLSDGSSDRALMPLLEWLLRQHLPDVAIQGTWADLRPLWKPPATLSERIQTSVNLFPCDLLFIHRDAERVPYTQRVQEIDLAVDELRARYVLPPTLSMVPVRMQEAWLLIDEAAIRSAAGNPHGTRPLALPRLREIEEIPDPKTLLHDLLRAATENRGRRRRKTRVQTFAHRVAELIDDFSSLRQVRAFAALEHDIVRTVQDNAWANE